MEAPGFLLAADQHVGLTMTTQYQARIFDYCQRNGITVPDQLDSPKFPERFVLIDESCSPPCLLPQSAAIEKDLLVLATAARDSGRTVRLLDFKRCCELTIAGDGKFKRFRDIDAFSNAELKQQNTLNQSDA